MTYILIDTANTFFRSRHVINGSADIKLGMAFHITLNSIKKAWNDFDGNHLVFCLEGRSWRKDYYEPYKRNRAEARAAASEREQEEDRIFWEAFDTFKDFLISKTNATVLQHPNLEPAGSLSDEARTTIRRTTIGFVYQFHHLLPEFTAAENIILPQLAAGKSRAEATERAKDLLAIFGLQARLDHRPGKLSGGEQQRVAIARALANQPRLLLADEPTGNLDVGTSDRVFAELLEQVRGQGLAALIATHNPDLARRMDRVVTLRDRKITPG